MLVEEIRMPNFNGSGKVRQWADFGDKMIFVTTDRISAFDVVLPSVIPFKGAVLNLLSAFWMEKFKNIIPNHIISLNENDYLPLLGKLSREEMEMLRWRTVLAKKADPLPVECVVRGYISGSAWDKYKNGNPVVCGITLPSGLKESDHLAEPIFTPTTKEKTGHDKPITFEELVGIVGLLTAEKLRDFSIELYTRAHNYAKPLGVIIADTKFEFGVCDGQINLIDEVLTPDSSRFWEGSAYAPGRSQSSYDKQFVRDWLKKESGWDMKSQPPSLPAGVREGTSERYIEAYEILVGKSFPAALS